MKAYAMGDFVGAIEDPRKRREGKLCIECGSLKSDVGEICQQCAGRLRAAEIAKREQERRLSIRRERETRFSAALEAGWTVEDLYRERDGQGDDPLPTWEEIAARDIGVVIKRWCQANGVICIRKRDGGNATI